MKKSENNAIKNDEVFFREKLQEWKTKSEEYRQKYEKSGDPLILADFIKSSIYALKEEWVINTTTNYA